MEFSGNCPHCRQKVLVDFDPKGELPNCAKCSGALLPWPSDRFRLEGILTSCPACNGPHLYKQKDFNRKLGLAILLLGIGGAYFTYGLSLLAVTVFDWWLYRRVDEVGCCYQCQGQYRYSAGLKELEPFSLILHDHYRSRRDVAPDTSSD